LLLLSAAHLIGSQHEEDGECADNEKASLKGRQSSMRRKLKTQSSQSSLRSILVFFQLTSFEFNFEEGQQHEVNRKAFSACMANQFLLDN